MELGGTLPPIPEDDVTPLGPTKKTLFKTISILCICFPCYPCFAFFNNIGCGNGCGYYWGIPLCMIPHNERPPKKNWPGIIHETMQE